MSSSREIRKQERLDEIEAAYARLQSWRAVARELKLPRSTVRHYQRQLGTAPLPVAQGSVHGLQEKRRPVPKKGVRRYICTAAQNNTYVHEQVWDNLQALAEHYDAEIMVSRFAYNKDAYTQPVKPGTSQGVRQADLWYDPVLDEHICDERVELAPGLVFCGEMNILPTAVRPLSGFHSYTGRKSAIFPHVKIAMESIASAKDEGVKLNFTTGTVTLKNYIQKKAGLKAEFHHCFGALLVEVDSKGRWFCRQLNADSEGVIHDLDLKVEDGKVTDGHRVEAINWGDIHTAQLDLGVARLGWGKDGMLDTLHPRYVFLHDLVDFRARNHHDRGNPHEMYTRFVQGEDSVQEELQNVVTLLDEMGRDDCKLIVVDSNHDNALNRWLREADYRYDPPNALFFLRAQVRKYEAIKHGEDTFHSIEWALRHLGCDPTIEFLREDQSFIICKSDKRSGVECGHHGHLGPNGARGNPGSLAKISRRANTGHTHSSCIIDGLYVAGASCKMRQNYNKGPSSWTHSHIVTYPNGKRCIVTMYDGAWRAE